MRRIVFSLSLLLASASSVLADTPKYIFYFIGDGMGIAPAMASITYSRNVLGEEKLPLMFTFPHVGQVMTWSASSDVTDSAAAGTALATGHKTRNSMLGMDADSIPVTSVATLLKQKGYGVGLVTNVAADDATPGAFYAHVPARWMREEIDRQFVGSGFEFLAGSALEGLYRDGKSTGVLEEYAKNDIDVIYDPSDRKSGRRTILLQKDPFQGGNTGYMIDSIPGMLTLPQMTRSCLDHLTESNPDSFFMMVEGGNIDHALHGNDALTAITEIYNFNNALEIAYEFLNEHPAETLIVVTADHDTGGISVGNEANGYVAHFDVLKNQKMSKEMFSDICKKMLKEGNPGGWESMQALLREKFGFWDTVPLTEGETNFLADLYGKVFEQKAGVDEKNLYNDFNAFASGVFRTLSQKAAVGWTSGAHTGNPVGVYAVGVGSENFGRFFNNTELPMLIYSLTE